MSLDIAGTEYLNDYRTVNRHAKVLQKWDVQLFLLFMATVGIGLVLAVYVRGDVTAAFIATSTPREEQRAISRQSFRGFPILVFHRLLKGCLLSLFPAQGSSVMKCFLLSVLSDLVLSTLKVANVQTILKIHPQVSLHRRILNQSTWFDIFPAALLYSAASSSSFYLTIYAVRILGFLEHGFPYVPRQIALYIVIETAALTYFGAMLPAYAIFIRVAASMDPLQGNYRRQNTGYLDIKSAWQGLNWTVLNRLIEVFGVVFMIELCVKVCVLFFSLVYFPEEKYDEVGRFCIKYAG